MNHPTTTLVFKKEAAEGDDTAAVLDLLRIPTADTRVSTTGDAPDSEVER
jgi:hypothetical protein